MSTLLAIEKHNERHISISCKLLQPTGRAVARRRHEIGKVLVWFMVSLVLKLVDGSE